MVFFLLTKFWIFGSVLVRVFGTTDNIVSVLAASLAACLLTSRLFEFLHINIEAFSSDTYVAIDLRKHECFEIYFS